MTSLAGNDVLRGWKLEDLGPMRHRAPRAVYDVDKVTQDAVIPPELGFGQRPIILRWETKIDRSRPGTWPPRNSCLGDSVLYQVLAAQILSRGLSDFYPEDFAANGLILRSRMNRGHAANANSMDGLVHDIIFKGYYLLQGDLGIHHRGSQRSWLSVLRGQKHEEFSLHEEVESLYDLMDAAPLIMNHDSILIGSPEELKARAADDMEQLKSLSKSGSDKSREGGNANDKFWKDRADSGVSVEVEDNNGESEEKNDNQDSDLDVTSISSGRRAGHRKCAKSGTSSEEIAPTEEEEFSQDSDPDIAAILSSRRSVSKETSEITDKSLSRVLLKTNIQSIGSFFDTAEIASNALLKLSNVAKKSIEHEFDLPAAMKILKAMALLAESTRRTVEQAPQDLRLAVKEEFMGRSMDQVSVEITNGIFAQHPCLGRQFYRSLTMSDN